MTNPRFFIWLFRITLIVVTLCFAILAGVGAGRGNCFQFVCLTPMAMVFMVASVLSFVDRR
jgi:hypothetical protein